MLASAEATLNTDMITWDIMSASLLLILSAMVLTASQHSTFSLYNIKPDMFFFIRKDIHSSSVADRTKFSPLFSISKIVHSDLEKKDFLMLKIRNKKLHLVIVTCKVRHSLLYCCSHLCNFFFLILRSFITNLFPTLHHNFGIFPAGSQKQIDSFKGFRG